ncbi:hypothetical protein [Metabacillus sp. B2-18]|uniref:hypothetical protein n=1 Tax=Metabacillus sp. B2-18 TaxID=2897333 RepID=UPI001E4F85E5|nr:hypothetical protein [Metabacillus sp. B2-18]UGB31690.1 hypothetical protein LPC09_04200 [Metabacillus sp. B2-18]
MNILVGDKYKITSDKLNITVNESYEKLNDEKEPTGEIDFKPIGHFGNLVQACNFLLDRDIKIGDAENLSELFKEIHAAKKRICESISNK